MLICGNGFFKPNISTIVGSLYPPDSPRRDGGFTIFYMGINLGAAMSPLLCGYLGQTYGWPLGFGLAGIGMLLGIAVFVARSWIAQILIIGATLACALASLGGSTWVAFRPHVGHMGQVVLWLQQYVEPYWQRYLLAGLCLLAAAAAMAIFRSLIPNILIAAGALAGTAAMFVLHPDNPICLGINVFVGLSLLAFAAVAWVALMRGGLAVGRRPARTPPPRAGPRAQCSVAGLPGSARGDRDLCAPGLRLLGPAPGQAGRYAGSRRSDEEPRSPP